MAGMDLLAQSSVTVPAPVIEHHVPLWQMAAAGGVLLLALVFIATLIVVAVASFHRDKLNPEK